jgi:hybrid cluster-associated redox disulfide protein
LREVAPAQRRKPRAAVNVCAMSIIAHPCEPDLSRSVDDIMRLWPQTIRVFLDHRMHCVGCPIGTFHNIADSCREHGVDRDAFTAELRRAI